MDLNNYWMIRVKDPDSNKKIKIPPKFFEIILSACSNEDLQSLASFGHKNFWRNVC